MANLLKIKELAKARGITLRQLAESVGISEQAMQKLMQKNSTSIATLEAIALQLEVAPSAFFDGANDYIGGNVANHGTINDSRNIKNVNSHSIDRCLDMLGEQLGKKDDQIDRLIGLLEGRRCGDGR